jgi:hypothetical protein
LTCPFVSGGVTSGSPRGGLGGKVEQPAQVRRVLECLFGEASDKKAMRLVDTQTVDGDVAFLTYEVVRGA